MGSPKSTLRHRTPAGWDEGQGRKGFGRRLFLLRFRRLGISQEVFAKRFGLTLGVVKDLEQGRTQPTSAIKVLVTAIEMDPLFVAQAAAISATREGSDERR
jgi:transcriptional regulator with XRE-family HTH domain